MRFRNAFLALGLLSTLLAFSCKEKEPFNPNIITEDFYFQAVLDGDTVTYQESLSDYYNIVGDFAGLEAANGWCYTPFTCIAKNAAATNPIPANLANSGAIGIVAVSNSQVATQSAYEAMVATGTFPIGRVARDSSQTAVAGAFISVMDENGVEWNTDNGPLGTGNLVVTEYAVSDDDARIPATHRIFAATFTCTVYNATGASKALTGGKVRGRMIQW